MKKAQIYCTLREVIADMGLAGDDGSLLERIRAASVTIERELGNFIPTLEIKKFSGRGKHLLVIDPVLSVTQITVNDSEVSDYTLLPETPLWTNGPYIKVKAPGCWGHTSVEIEGVWGKYIETRSVLEAVTLTDSETTLGVEDASQIDTGMVLQIEDEQILIVSGHGSKDSPSATTATSLLDGAIDENEEILSVDDGSEFHNGEVILVGNEDLCIRRIIGNDLTVERGWNGTPIEAHEDDAEISVYRTFAIERGVNGSEAASHDAAEAVQFVVPEDVNWLCRQIAGLMYMKAKSGFQGRVGSADSGESMYFSEFPPNQIQRIKNHYSIKVY